MRRFTPGLRIGMIAVASAVAGFGCNPPDTSPPTAEADSGLYCQEHGVPEKFCTLCHPELGDSLLLCAEHGDIPEDICTLCHPEVEQKHDIVMCPEGHGLPEHFCIECAEGPSA